MTSQITISGDEHIVELTRRQQFALEKIEAAEGGLRDDELGAVLHQYRSAHSADQRCRFCGQEGKSMGADLRAKGFVVRRRTGFWQSTRSEAERSSAVSGAGAAAPDGSDRAAGESGVCKQRIA